MAELPEFQKKQFAFAAHINNLLNLLSNMFPVLKKLLPDTKWRSLVRQFMQRHRAETPYFLQLPEEFLAFLQHEYELQEDDFPFLIELAHYEYIELALSISEERNDLTGVDPDGDLLANVPVKSDLTWIYAYQYPVHRISSDYIPTEPAEQPVFLAVYRGIDDKVGFLELNPITAGLLELISQNDSQASGEDLLRALAEQVNYPDVGALIQHGAAALEEMRKLEILTGTRAPA